MTISEEGKNALAEWKKIRDYTVPSVTLSFSKEAMRQALEIAVTEKMLFGFGRLMSHSIEVPAGMVCVFSHLSPRIVGEDENDTEIPRHPGRRRLLTPEESSELMKQKAKEWQKK